METQAEEKPRRRRYKIRGPETWALIREGYLSGASARELAGRYDVTRYAIARRAWREGWTKRDRPEGPLSPALQPLARPEAEGEAPEALARSALRGVAAAMAEGRLEEAKTLAQLADVLTRIQVRAPQTELDLDTLSRALLDSDYAEELMRVDHRKPDPVKVRYWEEHRRQSDDLRAELEARIARIRADVDARELHQGDRGEQQGGECE